MNTAKEQPKIASGQVWMRKGLFGKRHYRHVQLVGNAFIRYETKVSGLGSWETDWLYEFEQWAKKATLVTSAAQ